MIRNNKGRIKTKIDQRYNSIIVKVRNFTIVVSRLDTQQPFGESNALLRPKADSMIIIIFCTELILQCVLQPQFHT